MEYIIQNSVELYNFLVLTIFLIYCGCSCNHLQFMINVQDLK